MTKRLKSLSESIFDKSSHRNNFDFKVNLDKQRQEAVAVKATLELPWYQRAFNEFCNATALHGYSYIVRKDLSILERVAWAIIVLIALISSIMLLWISWHWNADTPTTTVIESTHYGTSNIPFPAVTICNMNKISKRAALRLATQMKRPENVSVEDLSAMFRLVLHFEGIGNASIQEYHDLHNILEANSLQLFTVVELLAPSCQDMLERCMWKGTQIRCDNLFQTINTTEGICCSFNNYALAKSNYPLKLVHGIPKVPRRVTACGYQTGLTVIAKPLVSDYHSTYLSSFGFRVFIHDSYDFVDDNAESKAVTSRLEAFLSVSPESTYSTPAVALLSPDTRDCYFPTEQQQTVMRRYSFNNCMAECRSAIILNLCGCVPYQFPNNGSLPTCGMNKVGCIRDNRKLFTGAIPGLNKTMASLGDSPCKCLPDCELLQYPSEISSGTLNREFSFNSIIFFKDIVLTDQSLIHVFFNDLISTHYRKDIYQNWLGLLASFGGLLGLLLGFSFITGFELIYFFTLRPLFDRWADKKRRLAQG